MKKNEGGKMRKRISIKFLNLQNNNQGVASIVVAVLLIGLLFTFLSYIQMNQVPDWTEEREAEHMNKVANQFTQLKFAVDMLSTVDISGNKITTDITLGTKEIPLPFLQSGKSYGYLKSLEDSCKINITDQTPNLYSYFLESIQYSSRNTEYVNMDYIYEAGGVIINQKTGNIIYIAPYFSVDYSSSVDISFDAVNFSDNTGNKHTTGHGNSPILLEYIGKNVSTINNVDTIDIATDYKSAWHNYLNSTLSDSGLTYGSANDYIITENDNEISVDFNDALIVNLYIKVIEINFQIGPGWIIS